MAESNFTGLLRQCIGLMYKNETIISVESIAGYRQSEQAKEILIELIELVMQTDFTKPDTKEFLSNKYKTYRSISICNGCATNKHTSRSRISYDLSKLKGVIGEDAIKIILGSKDKDLSIYKDKIQQLLKKYKEKSLLDGFAIKIPQCNEMVTGLSEKDRWELARIISMSSKKSRARDEKNLTSDMIGYIKYLEGNKGSLQGDDLDMYQTLVEWLG